jgi:hypothetical protein
VLPYVLVYVIFAVEVGDLSPPWAQGQTTYAKLRKKSHSMAHICVLSYFLFMNYMQMEVSGPLPPWAQAPITYVKLRMACSMTASSHICLL